jgi:hypothetical protein
MRPNNLRLRGRAALSEQAGSLWPASAWRLRRLIQVGTRFLGPHRRNPRAILQHLWRLSARPSARASGLQPDRLRGLHALTMMSFAVFFSLIAYPHSAAAEDFTTSIKLPKLGQSNQDNCGPASVQMALKKKPCRPQKEIYKYIRDICKDDFAFLSCPDGLRSALRKYSGEKNKYQFLRGKKRGPVMFDILAGVARDERPAEVLVFEGSHWAVVKGLVSNENPLQGGSINLKYIDVIDPYPPRNPPHDDTCTRKKEGSRGGAFHRITPSTWFHSRTDDDADDKQWWWKAIPSTLNGMSTGDWAGKYGGIGFNKKDSGLVGDIAEAPPEPTSCASEFSTDEICPLADSSNCPISEEDAIACAQDAVEQFEGDPNFAFLETSAPRRAILVNTTSGEGVPEEIDQYYLVLWSREEPLDDTQRIEGVRGAVIVNAYTGVFQEIAALFSPLDYTLSGEAEGKALDDAGFDCCVTDLQPVIQYSKQTRSRLLPVWRVEMEEEDPEGDKDAEVRFVPQTGPVFKSFRPGRGGA